MATNRYTGTCKACLTKVPAGTGICERTGYRKWIVWCMSCFNASDNSGEEDRCCGNRAYEDRCAEMVGGDYQAGW